MTPRTALLALPALALLGLTACAPTSTAKLQPTPTASSQEAEDTSGATARTATEVAEPPLGLLSVSPQGDIGLLDLRTEEQSRLGKIDSPSALASDGRFAFVSTEEGLQIIDSGRWSWNHGDHFHYYRAEGEVLGLLPGRGPARIASGMLSTAGSTGVYFAGSGEALLLDNEALSEGRIDVRFRVAQDDGTHGLIAPLGDGALLAEDGQLIYYDASGAATATAVGCAAPEGTITTRAALVVGCTGGAVIATASETGSTPTLSFTPFPAEYSGEQAHGFSARKGRPVVAALATDGGFWLLDTRDGTWRQALSKHPLAQVTAVDDDEGHVVALDTEGRLRVYRAANGDPLGATDAVATPSTAPPALTVDGQHAYLGLPDRGLVLEIAYRGETQVTRTLAPEVPAHFFAEVGR